MALAKTDDSATIGATEYSLPNDANYSSGSPMTTDVALQGWIDFGAMTATEEYRVRIYEKVNAGTQRVVWETYLANVQAGPLVLPTILLMEGWDISVKKIAGTDRSIAWSLRTL